MGRRVASILVVSCCLEGSTWAQGLCPDYGDAGTVNKANIYLHKSDGSCTVDNGGYAKHGQSYKAHFEAEVTGYCQTSVPQWSGSEWVCVDGALYVRNLGLTKLSDSNNPLPGYFGAVSPSPPTTTQILDTRVPTGTTSTGMSWPYSTAEGGHAITSLTNWNTTNCNFEPLNFFGEPFQVNVVKCVPQFDKQPDNDLRRLAPSAITISIDPDINPRMRAALEWAIDRWNDAIPGYPTLTKVYTGPCTPGPLCINTVEDDLPSGLCGKSDYQALEDGIITNSTITFPPQTSWWSETFDQWVAGHELTHHFGLKNNNSSCPSNETLMKTHTCNAPSGYATQPTTSDKLSVNGPYGGGPTTACPAQ